MRELIVKSKDYGPLTFVGDSLHKGEDAIIRSNSSCLEPDYLFFFDSRGVGQSNFDSLSQKLIDQVNNCTYLLICRPLHMTIWATLVNFMKSSRLNPQKIITNMGFVDFTPKKESLLLDSINQVNYAIGEGNAEPVFKEQYILANGETTDLYTVKYSNKYKVSIEELVSRHSTVVINTPPVRLDIGIDRIRPPSFFDGIQQGNEFNSSISGVKIVNPTLFDESMTYDAVHYTEKGSNTVFNLIRKYL